LRPLGNSVLERENHTKMELTEIKYKEFDRLRKGFNNKAFVMAAITLYTFE
jgi:hypothetical protein